jgi:hypothetical protein
MTLPNALAAVIHPAVITHSPAAAVMASDHRLAYEWLRLNGIDEWLPPEPVIAVDDAAGTLTFDCYCWPPDADHWDLTVRVTRPGTLPEIGRRTVRLIAALTPTAIKALEGAGARLITSPGPPC